MGTIQEFYTNKCPSGEGLFLKDMWDFNDWQMENTHHFIQWMFPIELESKHYKEAPVVSDDDLYEAFKSDEFKQNLLKSLYKIEDFWGFDVVHDGCPERDKNFRNFLTRDWFTPYNHNFIRIPRVLHSLVIFGLQKEALELLDYIEKKVYPNYQHVIGEKTLEYWKSAVVNKKYEEIAA
jgi:hypothetical protein